jgi:hypothetical protein
MKIKVQLNQNLWDTAKAVLRGKLIAMSANIKKSGLTGHWWLTPVILATQEAEVRRITVQNQHGANSSQDLILKKPIT